MHSLLPDSITLHSLDSNKKKIIELSDGLFENSKTINAAYPVKDLLYSFGRNKVCGLELNNFPNFLRKLQTPTNKIDVASADILRDRERLVPRYNDFRRAMLLSPITSFDDLTTDKRLRASLKRIYSNDIEKLDLLIGTHLECKMTGCVFGETIYQVFLLHTIRRVTNDKFYTTMYNAETYTQFGINYIEEITFKKLLIKHYPELSNVIPYNAFGLFS